MNQKKNSLNPLTTLIDRKLNAGHVNLSSFYLNSLLIFALTFNYSIILLKNLQLN